VKAVVQDFAVAQHWQSWSKRIEKALPLPVVESHGHMIGLVEHHV
jgi:hypothetical protein